MQLNNYLVPIEGLKVSVQTAFESEDLSGETSSTASAHKGIKPKEISAGFIVANDKPQTMAAFYAIAEAVDSNGDLVVYDITERTVNSANVRQVQFCGNIDQRETEDLNAWQISFRLKQFLSVAEKTEQRQELTQADTASTESLTRFDSIVEKSEQALA